MNERNAVEVLAEEFLSRCRRGENPTVAEYVERHPEHADQIEELFPAMLLMERLKPHDSTGTLGPKPKVPETALERLGDFRIVRELGRGGMGIVYEAVQESLGRRVALKVLPPGSLASPGRLERFRREAMATAGLHHQNIVQVFGVGEQDGTPYYVMQLISGRGIDQILADEEQPPTPREAAGMTLQAARALEHAHAKGIIHRDVKPENIRVDESGTVWLTDFGLAKVLAAEALTETGDLLGTIRYMAPERFEDFSDARADIYGLGLTLYELLVGRKAFAERDRATVIEAIREEGPERPRRVDPSIPTDLETIVLTAIALDPSDRYQTAAELAEDLERYLEDRPILARPAGAVERARRWCRRNRTVAALGATAAVSLILAAVFGWIGTLMTTNALEREEERRGEAEAATRRAVANEQLSLAALEEIFENLAGGEDRPERGPRRRDPADEARLLESILSFYDAFAERNATNPRMRLEAARARRRVGMIQERRGFEEEAKEAFAKAVSLLEALHREFPDDPGFAHELAILLVRTERHAEALVLLDAALEASPEVPDPRHHKRIQHLRAETLRALGREEEAREAEKIAGPRERPLRGERRGPRPGPPRPRDR